MYPSDKKHIAVLLEKAAGPGNVKTDEPMRKHTSFGIGGPADFLVLPCSVDSIHSILDICRIYEIPFFVMGNGTNLLVRDKGIRGLVMKLFDNFSGFTVEGEFIKAEAGMLLSRVSNIALEAGLAGMEFASGIPGTLGGAVAMNAGAYDGEMKDVVIRTDCLDKRGNMVVLQDAQHMFGYRTSVVQAEELVVLRTEMKLVNGNRHAIMHLMDELNNRRKFSQPLDMPSAGSVFKRPRGYYTGPLIESCGLKGFRIGGAEVSTKHCGFIVNTGNAAAEDVINLIDHIRENVRLGFGVDLKPEIKIVGEE